MYLILVLFLGSGFSLFFRRRRGFNFRGLFPALLESVHGSGGIYQFLGAGVKRMALAANFRMDFLLGRTGNKSMAASTNHFGVIIKLWVNFLLHDIISINFASLKGEHISTNFV